MGKHRDRDEDWKFGSRRDAALAGVALPRGRSWRAVRAERRATVALLSEVAALGAVAPEVLAELAGAAHEVDYPAGRVLASQGSRAESCLVVLSGSVVESRGGVAIAEHGEQSLLNFAVAAGIPVAPSTLVARSPVRAVVLDQAALAALIDAHPEVGEALLAFHEEISTQTRAETHPPHPSLGTMLRPRSSGSHLPLPAE